MDINPYTETQEQASEYLRLAITLLSKYKIPLTPLNYRIAYDLVSGKNEALKISFDEIIAKNDRPDSDSLWKMYNHFYIQDDKTLGVIRGELKNIINNIQEDFDRSGTNLSSYTEKLKQFSITLGIPSTPEKISIEVNKIIKDTCTTEETQRLFESQLSNIANEMEALRQEITRVREESLTDSLTSIANRKAFDAALEEAVHAVREQQSPYCLLLLDIDHFKKVNDNYGHIIGDKVLRFVATTLKRCIKGKDMVARFGGEEFAVILPGTDMSGAYIVAEQIRQSVSSGTLIDTISQEAYGKVTISIGVTQITNADLPINLLQRADRALYRAKECGRDRVEKAA